MEKFFFKNRKGQKIAVTHEGAESSRGIAFIMHGLGGFKEQPQFDAMAKAFLEHGFSVIRFDTANTFGESEGSYEEATITNYLEDLEDVIAWAKPQLWYKTPFILVGHSLGGICTALYAEKHPTEVLALAPISTVVSGVLSVEAQQRRDPEGFAKWKRSGWREDESRSKPRTIKRLPWSHMEDRLRYDLIPCASALIMPVLMIVGEKDDSTPVGHIQKLFEALPGQKELHVIKNAEHTFRDPIHLAELTEFFSHWLTTIR